jgi:hypothetical protein
VRQIFARNVGIGKIDDVFGKASLGRPAEIEDHFDDRIQVGEPNERLPDRQWKDIE